MASMIKFLCGLPFSYRQKKLIAHRPSLSKEKFVEDIFFDGGDKEAAGILWDLIAKSSVIDGFTPYPDDSLGYVFGIAEEDLDEDIIMRIFIDLKLPLPDENATRKFGMVDSARRIAQFVHQSRVR